MSTSRIVSCPQCGRPVEWTPEARWRPFCSERCKLIDLGSWLDMGRTAWLGFVHTAPPAGEPPTDADITTRLLGWWRDLGYTEVETLPETTITPTCGLAGASPAWAQNALLLCQRVARNLSVEQGRMEP